ncbi:hypothetical protein HAPAU_26770 [Halalkalicoccus paucihalophilus]|uniref:Uncharacterized protein n=1 Tax=Halalkalicoccus paucihalophilus TaxID=1008153 RepID=A0A151ABY0_9EURY|nr:hypothetical protein HAPAU_26770 [Halalkalicoccus paucihalophilus]
MGVEQGSGLTDFMWKNNFDLIVTFTLGYVLADRSKIMFCDLSIRPRSMPVGGICCSVVDSPVNHYFSFLKYRGP